ncbi:flocculation protein FLO11-like [Ostrinia furnacalis]|uniref:flocculation protein FLO11-like n=1 Tax=Ostrinia furnacalis TaxID=93504 RepID=UPI001039DFEF|nr:flocculation protein FLO11-like [Ostrinia furnacalis]
MVEVLSQYLTRQIEQPRNIIGPQVSSSYPLVESPYNTFVPYSPGIPSPSSTTIITDCSPTACKNLANTLQLMIVANLLQNSNGGSDLALQMAAPLINELFTSPTLSCGCANPFAGSISCQRYIQPYNYPQVYSEAVIERYAGPSPQIPPMSTADNDVLCKNLATAIQNVIFDRFSQSCLRKPTFGQIASPLISDIKNSLCQCPVCSSVNLTPSGYSKSYVSPSTVSNIIQSSVPNTISRIVTANISLHPALKQYLLSSLGTSPPPINTRQPLPAVTISKQTSAAPNLQSLAALATLLSSAHSTPPPKAQPPAANALLAALTDTSSVISPSVDTALLNNLAMAMQLLIVSNLLSSPQESTPEPPVSGYSYEPEPVQPVSVSYASHPPPQPVPATPVQPQHQYTYESTSNYSPPAPTYNYPSSNYNSMSMPNSNYVGSSSFATSSSFMGSVPPPTSSGRNGFSLMSPYEALSPSSPFSDPILSSPYGSVMTSKKDFQSPYSSFMTSDSKDLFSMGDFF